MSNMYLSIFSVFNVLLIFSIYLIVDEMDFTIKFAPEQIKNHQSWDDYVELLNLAMIFVGGVPSLLLLGRGSMFVFSTEQFRQLLNVETNMKYSSLLDIGAGDGATTQRMAHFFNEVSATEISPPMRWALAKKNFRVLELDDWVNHKFDVVTCLNVLDRCDSPITLIQQMKSVLNPGGFLLIAIVLPYIPYVETNKSLAPTERLPLEGKTAEEQINSFATDFVDSLGLKVLRWTKLPYFSEGDVQQSYYWLDDYLFLLTPAS